MRDRDTCKIESVFRHFCESDHRSILCGVVLTINVNYDRTLSLHINHHSENSEVYQLHSAILENRNLFALVYGLHGTQNIARFLPRNLSSDIRIILHN